MRNKLLPVTGLIILFFLFSGVGIGFARMDGVPGKPAQEDSTQVHDFRLATGKSDGTRPALLQDNEKGTEKPESNEEPGPLVPGKDTNRPKAPAESGPLTPFKPSEEIRADQAVDFPYDI